MSNIERADSPARRRFLRMMGFGLGALVIGKPETVFEKSKKTESPPTQTRLPKISSEERAEIERDYMSNELESPFYIDEYGVATWGWILSSEYESTSWTPQGGLCLREDRKRPWATEDIRMKDGRILHVVFEYPDGTSLENGKPVREKGNGQQEVGPDVKVYNAYSELCSGDEDYSKEREYGYIEGPDGQKTYYVVEHGKCDRKLHDGSHRAVRVWFVQSEQEAIAYCTVSAG